MTCPQFRAPTPAERIAIGNRGSSLIIFLPLLLVLIAAMAATMKLSTSGMHFTAQASGRQKAFYVANGGLSTGLTRLYSDRATASASTTYTSTGSGSLGGGTYSYAIIQDPLNTSDPSRKQVTSTGTVASATSTVVQQVAVYPFNGTRCPNGSGACTAGTVCTPAPGTCTPTSNGSPTCDLAIFADTGTAGLKSLAQSGGLLGTSARPSKVHGNNTVTFQTIAHAAVDSYATYESVNDTLVTAQPLLGLNIPSTGAVGYMAHASSLHGGSSISYAGSPYVHWDSPIVPTLTSLGLHFSNGMHGAQQTVSRIAFPIPDWVELEKLLGDPSRSGHVVDADHVPFGSWNSENNGTGTWVVSASAQNFGTESYFVRGNAQLTNVTLANNASATIAATGWIEVDNLTLLSVNVGGLAAVAVNGTQTLRLLGKGNVYLGRGMTQSADDAMISTTNLGLNLTLTAAGNRIAGYSQTGDVWVKGTTLSGGVNPQLNLVGKVNGIFALGAAVASPPTSYCQPLFS